MSRIKQFGACFGFVMLGSATAQGFQLGGTVLDQRGKGYPGVVVRLTASSATAVTDAQGHWSLQGTVSVAPRSELGQVHWMGRNLVFQLAQPRRFQAEVVDLLGKRVGEPIDLRLAAGSQLVPWAENRPWLRTLVRWDGGTRELVNGTDGSFEQILTASRSLDNEFDTLSYSDQGVTRVTKPWMRGRDTLGLVQFMIRPNVPWDTLVDPRDGNKYRLVTLGGSYGMPTKQQWMGANLRFVPARGHFAPVTAGVAGDGMGYSWATAAVLPDSCDTTGCLSLVHEPLRGVCPQGWELTTTREWGNLFSFLLNQDERFYWGRGVMESIGGIDSRWDAVKLPYLPAAEVRDYFGLSIPPTTLNFWTSTPWPETYGPYDLKQDFQHRSQTGHMQVVVSTDEAWKTSLLPVRCVRAAP